MLCLLHGFHDQGFYYRSEDFFLMSFRNLSDCEMTIVVLNALPEEWGNFTSSLYGKKEITPFQSLWSLCKIEETRLKAKVDTISSEENQALVAMSRKKGRFGKFGAQNKRRNMDKVQCFRCNELGHYKRDCPKSGKDKRKKEEAHITEEREKPDAKKSKKEKRKISIIIEIIFLFK